MGSTISIVAKEVYMNFFIKNLKFKTEFKLRSSHYKHPALTSPQDVRCGRCKRYISTLIKNRVGDDGVPAILQYRSSDLYLTDRKETMAILQKDAHTPLHICK